MITGNDGANRITGGLGNDRIEGGKGSDTAVFAGNYAAYDVSNGYGKVFVEAGDGRSGFDTLIDVEWLAFADRTVAVDRARVSGTARQGQTLTAAATVANTTGNSPYTSGAPAATTSPAPRRAPSCPARRTSTRRST